MKLLVWASLLVGVGTWIALSRKKSNPWVEAQLATLVEQKKRSWR